MFAKGITARRANKLLGSTGQPFWQEESYDHLVRDAREMHRIRAYIEDNPVRAGIAATAEEYRWSSAWRDRAGLESHCGPGAPPHPLY